MTVFYGVKRDISAGAAESDCGDRDIAIADIRRDAACYFFKKEQNAPLAFVEYFPQYQLLKRNFLHAFTISYSILNLWKLFSDTIERPSFSFYLLYGCPGNLATGSGTIFRRYKPESGGRIPVEWVANLVWNTQANKRPWGYHPKQVDIQFPDVASRIPQPGMSRTRLGSLAGLG